MSSKQFVEEVKDMRGRFSPMELKLIKDYRLI